MVCICISVPTRGKKTVLILKFLTFFDVLNYIFQGLLSLHFWKRHEMLSAHFHSHGGSVAADWQKGMKSHRMGLLNAHEISHGKPWLFACSGFTGPSRCCWPPLQGGTALTCISCFPVSEDSTQSSGKPGESTRYRIPPQIRRRYHMPEIGETQAKFAYDPDHVSESTIWEVTGTQSTSSQFLN